MAGRRDDRAAAMWLRCVIAIAALIPSGCAHREMEMRDDAFRLLDEARSVTADLGDDLWPSLTSVLFRTLVVEEGEETLVCFEGEPPQGFTPLEASPVSGCPASQRARVFDPTFLATFPLSDGVPTIVIGTPKATGKTDEEWVVTVIHEHLHQLQYGCDDYFGRTSALGLDGGDETGMWMLDYPFPYSNDRVSIAIDELAQSLEDGMLAEGDEFDRALGRYRAARRDLEAIVSAADMRYFDFQSWQEGVARHVERKAAADWSGHHATARTERDRLVRELSELDLASQGRTAFYAIGHAQAILLDRVDPSWPSRYCEGELSLHSRIPPAN